MERIEAAILRTILYADVFSFPLNLEEIHRFLIHDEAVPLSEIQARLRTSKRLQEILHHSDSYYCLKTKEHLISLRQERESLTQQLWQSAFHYGRIFAVIPFVRMVALTGALAVRNPASERDDFDYMLVTEAGHVWTARLFAVVIVRLVRLFGRELCPNYVLAMDKLQQTRQDSFIAHEIAQMRPIYGIEVYEQMLKENDWAKSHLPNLSSYSEQNRNVSRLKSLAEWLLQGRFGTWLENWEYERKHQKFSPQILSEASAALIDSGQAKGHFKDNGHPILQQYHARLHEFGFLDESFAMAGD